MNDVTRLIAALKTEIGADAVLTEDADLAPFTEDWRGRYNQGSLWWMLDLMETPA